MIKQGFTLFKTKTSPDGLAKEFFILIPQKNQISKRDLMKFIKLQEH